MKHAGVYERSDRNNWYIYYPDPQNGRRVCKASPFRRDDPQGYRKALDLANERGKAGRAAASATTAERWEAWVPSFLNRHYTDPKSHTRAEGAWKQWRAFLAQEKIHVPQGFDYKALVRFLEWRTKQKKRNGDLVSKNTAICDIRVMSSIMQEAMRSGTIGANPCARPGFKRDDPDEKPEITIEEEALIRERLPMWAAENSEERGWMPTCFDIAMRHGCRLRETQIDVRRDVDPTCNVVTFHGKRKKTFATQLHPKLRRIVLECRKRGERFTCVVPLLASKRWREFFDSIDLQHLSFHCTRVTVVTRLARAGIPEQQAMAYVGHASRLVHKIYQRLKPADAAGAIAALS